MAIEGWSPERLERLARAEAELRRAKDAFYAARGIEMADFRRPVDQVDADRVRRLLGEGRR